MKLWKLLRGKRRQEELDEEIHHHLAVEIQERIQAGAPPEEAGRSARLDFGNQLLIKDVTRDTWGFTALASLVQDIRYGLRMLRRNPGFTTVVILTLALGIGMNTAVFSVVNAVLLRPLAYSNAERLIWLAYHDPEWGDNMGSRADYLIWKDQAHSFESMTAYGNQDLALLAAGEASQERITSITGDFWSMTGAQPGFGRLFKPGEPNMMVLSWGLFERRFGRDPQVIGKLVALNGFAFTIVGVLPKDFTFLFPPQWVSGDERRSIDAYISIPDAVEKPGEPVTQKRGPAPSWVYVVGKLRPNALIERARAEMETIRVRIAREYPSSYRTTILHIVPLKEKLIGKTRPALMVLLAEVGFVLLILIANVANLLLARASTRQREIAIRAAVGAGRMRVIRQILLESILLALLGGAAGLVIARLALAMVVRLGSEVIPRLGETSVDGLVLAFTLAVSLSTGVLFGWGPAISLWRANLHDMLKDDARTSSGGAGGLRLRGLLVAVELALAIVLLTGAGLMLKSFWRMSAYPPGFVPEKTLVMRVSPSGPQYNAWMPKQTYMRELLRRIETVPGVQAVGIDCGTLHTAAKVEGAPPMPPDKEPVASIRFVSPGYLRAMGVPLIKGHWPTGSESLFAIVVNESFTRGRGISGDPVGRHLSGSFLSGAITGVVADFKSWQLDAEPSPEVYYPYERSPRADSMRVVVRTSGDAITVAPFIRKLITDIDRTQPVYELQTLEQELSDSIAPRRFNLFLLGTFAATALLLAMVGIYGVTAYSVAQRTHEIGIRMALGAQRSEIVRMVVWQGIRLALAGIAIGLVMAVGLTRLMASLLYDVKPNDPQTFAAVTITLTATALLACSAPALKAALVDPVIALRYE